MKKHRTIELRSIQVCQPLCMFPELDDYEAKNHAQPDYVQNNLVKTACKANPTNMAWLELTCQCNLFCRHCYINAEPFANVYKDETLQFEDWVRVLHILEQNGFEKLQITGGEPTLMPWLLPLLKKAAELEFSTIELFTNATLLDETQMQFFMENDIALAVTVLGSDSNRHDYLTGTPGSLKKTMASIAQAVAYGIKLRCSVIIMDGDVEEAERIENMLCNVGVTQIGFDNVRNVGRGKNIVSDVEQPFCEFVLCQSVNNVCVTETGELFPCVMNRKNSLGHIFSGDLKEKTGLSMTHVP